MGVGDIFFGISAGLSVTLGVALYAMIFAVPFAFVFGVLQFLLRGYRRVCVTAVIEFWRSSSAIVLLFVFFYVLPFVGVRLDPYTVGAMVLGLNMGGYGTQVIRGALAALDRGQLEAARSLGLTRIQALLSVELPQAFRQMVPSFVNELIELIKLTALVSLITLADPTFRAKQIFQLTYQPAVIYSCLLVVYFVIGYPIARIGKRLERHFGVTGVVPK
jgi:polar amino acid transport system permease protein